jgi:hypothetical protein
MNADSLSIKEFAFEKFFCYYLEELFLFSLKAVKVFETFA